MKGGPNYGIDFKGGALMYLRFNQEPPVQKIRTALGEQDHAARFRCSRSPGSRKFWWAPRFATKKN